MKTISVYALAILPFLGSFACLAMGEDDLSLVSLLAGIPLAPLALIGR
jgi:hypothetical protein